ncbi:MAG: OmpH family outer membrane protein [Nevskiaceae bacterium]|nr:OmpH family outer membrane protein [Nevskiaceae bacterium]
MNRSLKFLLSTVLVAAGFVSAAQGAELKIGVVNVALLAQQAPQAKTMQDAITSEFAPKERDLQTQAAALKTRQEKLQKDAATMTESQRSAAEKELRDGARDLERKQAEVQDDFNARRNEELTRLQRVLFEEVQTYAKAQGFDLVLADGVLYATATIDITPAVLTALQAKRGGAAAAPAAK